MVFYGTKATTLKEGQLINVQCPNCEEGRSMRYGIYGKYAYLYWIPMFPVGKENYLECNQCKRTYDLKELPNEIKQKFELEKSGASYPIWYFSGLAVLAILVATAFYLSKKDAENDKRYIQEPLVGDVYSVETSQKGFYSSMKVSEVTADSIFVIYNDYEIDKKSKIYKIDKIENYTTERGGFSKAEIKSLFDENVIFEVDRD
ncbi:zinc-ribbon domain-containing protein [Olleya sp. YS]|uniref:zinc-ribbon domain-containing protein n=1 Tax=Olleya sp. YS TaxID=3028318 RepID=UPI0024343400|nr:zinc-ribbon domain-containing protein [Olleya sp. YS]WGD35192.1 zinc-ribbon domain-containing protein [Olleya sp. YS]